MAMHNPTGIHSSITRRLDLALLNLNLQTPSPWPLRLNHCTSSQVIPAFLLLHDNFYWPSMEVASASLLGWYLAMGSRQKSMSDTG